MGRNNTKAVKNIAKMYEQLGLAQDDIFHKTKLLLSIYRDVVWATLADCNCVNEEIYYTMVMLEQLKTVNQSDLIEYIGKIDDEHYMKKINIGIKKAMGLWVDKPYRKPTDIRCLCVKCLEDYKNNPNFIVKRLDPFARVKEKCDKCQNLGYDYLVIERSKEGR